LNAVLQTLEGYSRRVISVAFLPDSKLVVSSLDDRTVRLWDAVTGAALQTFEGHSDRVISVAFSPDGKLVVSVSDDRTVRLWDAVTGAALQTFGGHSDWPSSIAFSPNGKVVHTPFVSNNWVVEGRGNILWLPLKYRATCVTVWSRIIVFEHSLERISILKFKEGSKLM
jgi:WD40 repeat protein